MPEKFGSIRHDRYTIEAWLPASGAEPHIWTIRVFRDDTLVHQETLELDYPVTWGVDVSDKQNLEDRVELLLAELDTKYP